mmetsp:Transcript_14686/g.29457  ORF Transcript_14686/g.29457 Transcript_14686/m.29457 type:complete len:213 (+) Transcript_14686:278-916(+)
MLAVVTCLVEVHIEVHLKLCSRVCPLHQEAEHHALDSLKHAKPKFTSMFLTHEHIEELTLRWQQDHHRLDGDELEGRAERVQRYMGELIGDEQSVEGEDGEYVLREHQCAEEKMAVCLLQIALRPGVVCVTIPADEEEHFGERHKRHAHHVEEEHRTRERQQTEGRQGAPAAWSASKTFHTKAAAERWHCPQLERWLCLEASVDLIEVVGRV